MRTTPSLRQRARQRLEHVPALRHVVGLAAVVNDAIRDGSGARRDYHELRYAAGEDPYGARRDDQQDRYAAALELERRIAAQGPLQRVLEIGCGEGTFSAMLAPRVAGLLAVDVSLTAVARARQNLRGMQNVEVREWNMYRDPVPGEFDLIVIMTVLEYVHRPSHLRRIRDKLVAALAPGGYLLVESTAHPLQSTWYGRAFARGWNVNVVVAKHPEVQEVARIEGRNATFQSIMFRKKNVSER